MAGVFGRFNAPWSTGRRSQRMHERKPAPRHSLHSHNLAGTRPSARSLYGRKPTRRVPRHVHRFIFAAAGLLALIVIPAVLIPARQAARATRRTERGPPQAASQSLGGPAPTVQLADASSPRPAPSISPLIAIPRALTGNEVPVPPAGASGASVTGPGTTVASWYPGRPIACFQNGARHPLPSGLVMWAADKSLPCGSTIEVSGPQGTADLLIEDHGPYLTPDRGLDLSPEAFKKVVGPLRVGIAVVNYRVTHLG